ncbi:MAG: hypothetical protein JNJ54_25950 [Myxococcaceae bacterium]|nr:hypothetical protein [Myxococcaceae bacterium]
MGLPVKRDPQGRIVAGALNPSGRPKVDSELARAARELSPLALQVWEKTMKDYLEGKGSAADAIRAASDSMSRGFGKPPEYVQLTAELETPVDWPTVLRRATSDELALIHALVGRVDRRTRGEAVDEPLQALPPVDRDRLLERARRVFGILERANALAGVRSTSNTKGADDAEQDEEEA